jgi:hypothetical protein
MCAAAGAGQRPVFRKKGIMAMEGLQRNIAKNPAECRTARSSLVRRLVRAKDDPGKQRIRRWLSAIDDERLLRFGLTPEDIALLRGSGGIVKTVLSVPSPPGSWF